MNAAAIQRLVEKLLANDADESVPRKLEKLGAEAVPALLAALRDFADCSEIFAIERHTRVRDVENAVVTLLGFEKNVDSPGGGGSRVRIVRVLDEFEQEPPGIVNRRGIDECLATAKDAAQRGRVKGSTGNLLGALDNLAPGLVR